MLVKTRHAVERFLLKRRLKNLIHGINQTEYGAFQIERAPLDTREKQQVMSVWGKLIPGIKGDNTPPHLYYTGFQIFKSAEHFSPLWLTAPAMYPRIILALEDPIFQSALVHKAGFSMYLGKINQPRNVIKCISGQYFDEAMTPIAKDEAVRVIEAWDSLIIKSTYGSCQGKSIQKIKRGDNIGEIVDSYNGNFVCQELIRQAADIAKFHPSSVNTLRIVTLFINGVFSVCEIILRIGQNGAIVDNAGSGGIMIGCDSDGNLRDYGYDHFGVKHFDNGNGLAFKGQKIPGVDNVLELSKKYHTYYFPTMGVVAWDWTIGEDGKPIFIEANLGGLQLFPDITTSQLAIGKPFFGERTEEVIDFANAHQDRVWNGLKI